MRTAAIPTRYGGLQFRSRTEAKWAAFMDLLGWEWEDEPLDFDGYIPDFLVNNGFWLEVKAAMTLKELAEEAPKVCNALADQKRRAVIVGGRPLIPNGDLRDIMGLLVVDEEGSEYACDHGDCVDYGEPHAGAYEETFGIGALFRGWSLPDDSHSEDDPRAYDLFEWRYCGHHKQWAGAEDLGDWRLSCGCTHKTAEIHNTLDLEALWREASNLTQWHPKTK